MRKLVADHIKEMHAQADDQRRARRARRGAPGSTPLVITSCV
ncbi:MAG: hypothetical protein ACRDPF_11875 [Streptosporangiaceae bacterium]